MERFGVLLILILIVLCIFIKIEDTKYVCVKSHIEKQFNFNPIYEVYIWEDVEVCDKKILKK